MKKLLTILLLACTAVMPNGAYASFTVVGGLTRELTVEPGAVEEGRIIVRNRAGEPIELRLYQTDYTFTAGGRSSYDEPGTLKRSNALWVELTPKQITVPAGGTESVFFSVTVPDEPDMRGTYWSMVMIEPVRPEELAPVETGEDEVAVGIRTRTRHALQVMTHIGGTGKVAVDFIGRRLVADKGRRELQVDIENTGERYLRPNVWVQMHDAGGMNVGRFDARRRRIYPGTSARYVMDITELPPGEYNAMVIADAGDDNVFGARYSFSIPEPE